MPKSLSIMESQLIKGKETEVSSHEVREVLVKNIGKEPRIGYFKPCKLPKYPTILAKYVVAFSIIKRAALGQRAAEDRLVYKNGKIIGTVSFKVPGFIPLHTTFHSNCPEKTKKQKEYKQLVNPDKKTLLKEKVAPLLISEWKNQNPDVHPFNLSVKATIDNDESYYSLTSIIKGKRIGNGWLLDSPKIATELKKEDMHTFPHLPKRYHWPTHPPKTLNIFKSYKTTAFSDLIGDVTFIKQCKAAILIELLAFDIKIIQKRLTLYLGELNYNIDQFSKQQIEELAEFDREHIQQRLQERYGDTLSTMSPTEIVQLTEKFHQLYSLFYDIDGQRLSFIEHCLRFFEWEHKKFIHIVLYTKEFRDFLVSLNTNSMEFSEINDDFEKNNLEFHIPYQAEHLNQGYHCIWRESFKPLLAHYLEKLKIRTNSQNEAQPETAESDAYDWQFEKIELTPADSLTDSIVSINRKSALSFETMTTADFMLLKMKNTIDELHGKLSILMKQYYLKTNPSVQDNHTFITQMKLLLVDAKLQRITTKERVESATESFMKIKEFDGPVDTMIDDMNLLFHDINTICDQLSDVLTQFKMSEANTFQLTPSHKIKRLIPLDLPQEIPEPPENKENSTFSSIENPEEDLYASIISKESINLAKNQKEQIHIISKVLKNWIASAEPFAIKKTIEDTRVNDYSKWFRFFSARGSEVDKYSLLKIFSEGGWESTSLNTLLIKNLCLKAAHHNQMDSLQLFLQEKKPDWWARYARTIAIEAKQTDVKVLSASTFSKS